ncbi:ER lumen protein retaining receptor [Cystobasidium minutum MCA 4210]|uniref:ER lumen protein retaining receptor n=1 Tax=Cystobasidium minutum MCA 4210 TaxID=1397322 RepID=UPI0034CF7596|eukprot:jgi/Rhomi1/168075/fgenesh1_kg.2_\
MNIFRLLGDLSHLASILILIQKIHKSRSCRGISFKTQALYLAVFATRYVDLLTGPYYSFYNTIMKLVFLGSSAWIVYLMKGKYKPTQDPQIDTFKVEYLIVPCAILALIFNYKFTVLEVLWSFSIYLEAVAILPQLMMLQRTGEAETITTHYLFALGMYRGLYIPNWIYRYFADDTVDPIAVVAGVVQTVLYGDFFYIYFTKVLRGEKFELPA